MDIEYEPIGLLAFPSVLNSVFFLFFFYFVKLRTSIVRNVKN